MKTVTFFRAAVLAPLAVPVLLSPLAEHSFLAAVLLLALAFGGVQYALFAVFLWYRVGVLCDAPRIFRFMLVTPLLFVLIQFAGWLLWSVARQVPADSFESLLPFAAYVLVLGYAFMALVGLAFAVLRSRGLIEPARQAANAQGVG